MNTVNTCEHSEHSVEHSVKIHVTYYVYTHNVWRKEYSVEHNVEITYNAHTMYEQGSIMGMWT